MKDDFLARGVAHGAGLEGTQLHQLSQSAELVHQAFGGALGQPQQALHPLHQGVEVVHAQSPSHPAVGGEHIHQNGHIGAGDVLKEEGRAAGLDHPVGDFGDFQVPGYLGLDAVEVALAFEEGDVFSEVFEFHGVEEGPE